MTPLTNIGQPNPEIWSGGVEGGPLIIVSGSDYSEKKLYNYDINASPGSSTGLISFSNISGNYLIKNYKNSLYISLSNSGAEGVTHVPTINDNVEETNIKISGASESGLVVNTFKPELPITTSDISVFSTEKTGFSYNESSTKSFASDDFSLISDVSTSFVDYGQLTESPSQGNEDYNFVFNNNQLNPFGKINISGSALVIDPPNIRTYNTGANYRVVYNPPENTATLLNIGQKEESVSYDYNESSFIPFVIEDLESITNPATSILDYGLVSESPSGQEDNESIEFSTLSPFGSLTLSGSAETEYFNLNFYPISAEYKVTYSPDDTSGTLFGFGEKLESLTYDYNESSAVLTTVEDSGSIASPVTDTIDYGLITEIYSGEEDEGSIEFGTLIPFGSLTLSGSAEVSYVNKNFSGSAEYRVTHSPDNTSGTLFAFGEKFDSVTYDYNESSVIISVTEDSGSIASPVTDIIDYGFISESYSGQEDGGSVEFATLIPFGSLTLSGSADVIYTNKNFSGSAECRVTYSPDDTSGTLFAFGEKFESITYDYNESSILLYSSEDFSLITGITSQLVDYGDVTEIYGEVIDYGLDTGLGEDQTLYPFGSINISGSSGNIPLTYSNESTTLFVISGELIAPNIDYTPSISGSGTINLSGISNVSFISNSIVNTQIISLSETALESRTHSYNESSTFTDITPSFGFISSGLSETSDDYGFVTILGGETEDYGSTSEQVEALYPYGQITLSGTTLVYPDVDYTPSPDGSGTINITGSANCSETDSFGFDRRRGGTINITGISTYSEIDSYVGLGTIFLDQQAEVVAAVLARTKSYVGIETIILSDTGLESRTIFIPTSGIGTGFIGGTINILGNAIESFGANTPENTQLFTFSGELTHPQIDYTPHYGIEKNIGIGTTGIQISGVADKSEIDSYIASGLVNIVNGYSPQDTEAYPGGPGVGKSWSYTRTTYIAEPISINISTGIALTHYYSPVYPRNALITDPSSGIGTIRINDEKQLTFYRATLPIFAKGTIYILGIGTTANGDLDGVEFGATESFTPATEIGTGLFTISGISSTREINVYQGYLTDGLITISQQTTPIVEKYTASWVGLGTIFVSETLIERNTESYVGLGTIFALSGDSEAYSAQTPEETIIITVSGTAQESFIAQTPENTILYQFSGAATDEKLIKSYNGSGTIDISGASIVTSSPSYPTSGIVRFANTHHVDNLYDTCDSVDITSDEQDSAYVRFTANPQENTVLFDIDGNAVTSETALYTEFVVGLYTLFGTYQSVKLTHSESGIGTVFITETSSESERDVYIGSGNLFGLSGATEYYSAQTPESTIILQISGSALTSIESEYSTVGIGLFVFGGTGITSKITSHTQIGSGNITLSGQLVYPDIIFIPSPDGSGTINILGSSNESITKLYDDTSGTLFYFSSGFESFTKSTYTGIGTVYIQELNALTINNPFQIPRTYVCII
jgi:hypothetical protein